MNILILGGDGMLGHQLVKSFEKKFYVFTTLRREESNYKKFNMFNTQNTYFSVEATNNEQLQEIFEKAKPDAVINCIGLVKQRKEAEDSIECIKINSLLPHKIHQLCCKQNSRLIQISTDCVFYGDKGNYLETDRPDAIDLYGRSKLLGEVSGKHAITLRTSIIGQELSRNQGLVEWFLSQKGVISGYANAIYSGFTTIELASIIEMLITRFTELSGIWHVSSDSISKFDLLSKLSTKLARDDIEINLDKKFRCDRSLDGSKFVKATGYSPPPWDVMLDKLAAQIQQRNK